LIHGPMPFFLGIIEQDWRRAPSAALMRSLHVD
jgi:hypothetical protein